MAQALSRDEFLRPYLNRLPSMLAALREGEIPIGNLTLSVNPWEHAELARALAAGADAERWQRLLVEGVAFKIKLLQDLASSPVSPDNHEQLSEDSPLWADNAEGARLLDDLKAALNERILIGDKDNYKHLNEFRNKLFNFLSEVRHLENPNEEAAILPVSEAAVGMDAAAPAPASREAQRAGFDLAAMQVQRMASGGGRVSGMTMRAVPQEELAARKRRLLPLWAFLAISALAAALFLLWPAGSAEKGRIFTLNDFKYLKVVTAVEASPPTVTFTVAKAAWEKLHPPLRQSILVEIGKRLKAAGYSEAVIQTPDGVRRAGWTAAGGIAQQ